MPSEPCSRITTSPEANPSSSVRKLSVSYPVELTTGKTEIFSYVTGSGMRQSLSGWPDGSGGGLLGDKAKPSAPAALAQSNIVSNAGKAERSIEVLLARK